MEVDHHDVLLGVQLGAVHVEVEAVLVPDGVVGGGNRKFETSSCRLVVALAPVCVPRQSALRPGGGQGDEHFHFSSNLQNSKSNMDILQFLY